MPKLNEMRDWIESVDDLHALLSSSDGNHYVYVLCEGAAADFTPFYVGIGQGNRVFAHETEARESSTHSQKLDRIREIWSRGGDVLRYIDSFHDSDPWIREAQLIDQWGLIKDGTGILTNSQRYSRSVVDGGVELRKYAEFGNEIPPNFIRRNDRLVVSDIKPRSNSSVYGRICTVLGQNPGVTGEQLLGLLLSVDFSDIKSAYAATGQVSIPWLCKYIDGGFYKKSPYIQLYVE